MSNTSPATSTSLESSDALLVAAARERAAGGIVVIAFADSRYADVLMNWLVALALQQVDRYLVVALDRDLHALLTARGIPCVLRELHGDLGDLWVERVRVFAALCAAGIDFIHSDVDAVWLRDPRQAYFTAIDADLIASQGTVWPHDVHEQFGFVLCCGLFSLRSSRASRQLLGQLAAHVATTRDDQISLNRLLAERRMAWRARSADTYYLAAGERRFLCSKSLIVGEGADGLRVSVLPHHLFQRLPLPLQQIPFVSHPLTPKEPKAKLQEFARTGCLLLRPDWRQRNFDVHSLSTLRYAS
ncbi:MAG: putative nucleotide-diphospho-sugar transferase, partial [Steroidobacteraceae bacterium]